MKRHTWRSGLFACFLLAAFLVAGCSGQATTPSQTTPSASSTAPITSTPGTSTPSQGDDWPTYHRDLSRSGSDPAVSLDGHLRRLWTSDAFDGDIYAEPLVVGDRVLATTEHDSVYSLDVNTGKIQWQVNLGAPVPRSELACGDIDPSGITGTPVADNATGRLYVAARLEPDHHELFALDIATGTVLWHRTVDPTGADPRVQQQRAALALANGNVYVAFGGLYGDCGSYYGWVVGVPADGNGQLMSYRVSSHKGASLWAPSGPAVDSAGNLYVTSGNGFSDDTFDYSDSVLRLSSALTLKDWFAPANWQQLDAGDVDLGSMGPILLQGGLIFQAGKEGIGYLLRVDNLGHIGGEVYAGNIGHGAFGGAAYTPPYAFVPSTDGLVALLIDDAGPSFKVAWTGPGFFAGPPVVADGTVWTVDTGSGTLYGFAMDTGAVLTKIQLGPVMHFTTPALGHGSIFVAAKRQIIRLGP